MEPVSALCNTEPDSAFQGSQVQGFCTPETKNHLQTEAFDGKLPTQRNGARKCANHHVVYGEWTSTFEVATERQVRTLLCNNYYEVADGGMGMGQEANDLATARPGPGGHRHVERKSPRCVARQLCTSRDSSDSLLNAWRRTSELDATRRGVQIFGTSY